jgi:hypothetical protein
MVNNLESIKQKNTTHEACTSCRYCSMFKELNSLWEKADFSKKKFKFSTSRFGVCKTERRR